MATQKTVDFGFGAGDLTHGSATHCVTTGRSFITWRLFSRFVRKEIINEDDGVIGRMSLHKHASKSLWKKGVYFVEKIKTHVYVFRSMHFHQLFEHSMFAVFLPSPCPPHWQTHSQCWSLLLCTPPACKDLLGARLALQEPEVFLDFLILMMTTTARLQKAKSSKTGTECCRKIMLGSACHLADAES